MKRILLFSFLGIMITNIINIVPASAGWQKTRQGWFFRDADYGYCLTGQNTIEGQTYYFDDCGILDESRINDNEDNYKSYVGNYVYKCDEYEYNIFIKSIEKNKIVFSIKGRDLKDNSTNETDIVSILTGNKTDFEWYDSYENNGNGTLSLENNNVTLNMSEMYTIKNTCISLNTEDTIILKK